MVSTGNTVSVFRTTMKAIFGRRRDSNNSPLTTTTTSSPAPTPNVTLNRRFSSLQPTSQSRGATNNDISNVPPLLRHHSYTLPEFNGSSLCTEEEENEEEKCTNVAASDLPNSYTRNIIITRRLLDVMFPMNRLPNSDCPPFRKSQWQLVLNPRWTEYVLIYARLEYGLSILTQLINELKPYIDYYHILDLNQGILLHFKNMRYQYWILHLVNPVIGIQLVMSSPTWFHTVTNYDIISASREYNLQMVKYEKLPLTRVQRQVIKVYGISSFVPKKLLIEEFRKLGKLISFNFAPTGPLTRFHVVKLQYSKEDDKERISEEIKKNVGDMKCKLVLKVGIKRTKIQKAI
ncbi:hypothetical protein CORT_0A08860 [Candida orthopsilosis Co 90-125]|uniref:Uncharacterized protein n=1 Tax=Candida orthopsilosis (strain 90-125) TaxID=1136231 RepID=H8WYF5_CANO9|nr:hypothetical protein CORT_0A08860 [Candida orthopsilosis Co 90-125]CCG21270.1 hypothetical protein CORT_0A08860 [Candida orthopsilosis Co 90-125]